MNLKNIRLNNMLAAGIISIAAYSLIVILQSFSETYQIAFAFFDQLNSSYPFIFIFIIVSVPLSFGFIAYLVYIDKTTYFLIIPILHCLIIFSIYAVLLMLGLVVIWLFLRVKAAI